MSDPLNAFIEKLNKTMHDPEVQERIRRAIEKDQAMKSKTKRDLRSIVKAGDLILVQDCHHLEPHTYEVSRIDDNGPVSQPADFYHWWHEINAVYRLSKSGKTYRCIWRCNNENLL